MHTLPAAADATDSTEALSPLSTAVPSSTQTSSQQYNEVPLFELRLFADRIGYPVVVKGAVQGAAMCGSWPAVRETLLTQHWAQGGYLQKPVRGWEKCIAFAAYAGKLLGKGYSHLKEYVCIHVCIVCVYKQLVYALVIT